MNELSGKELGIAVAKEVMEWEQIQSLSVIFIPDYTGPFPAFYDPAPHFDWLVVSRAKEGVEASRSWAPWRDMNDAWEVVEKLLSTGWEVVVCGGFSGNLAACMVYKGFATSYPPKDVFLHLWSIGTPLTEELRIPSYREQSQVAQEAILRAALKAVRDEH